MQCLLVDVLAKALIGSKERRQPEQGVTGLRDEFLESTFLLSVPLAS